MARTYYSQNGEDGILWHLFKHKKEPGFFIDVGALDGCCFSNTYSFESEGWTGICIEAHPRYITYLKQNRNKSIIVHAAITDHDQKDIIFYANKRGALSTLVGELRENFKIKYKKTNPKWTPIKVPARTLSAVLAQHNVKSIDFISMDIEGGELAALKGFNFKLYKPRVWVIEAINRKRELATTTFMKTVGYTFARKISNNLFYCINKNDADIIRNAPKNYILKHTTHPCDLKE